MKPILIAEFCQNHNGDRDILKRMIHEATASGADYVKIQSIRAHELTLRERFETGLEDSQGNSRAIKRPYQAEFERMERLELTLEDESWFVDECLRAGVKSMTTVFTRATAQAVKDLGFEAVKIASYDCASYPLLREVRQLWSTVVVSTGSTYDNEIEQAVEILKSGHFALLHCVTIYPTPMHNFHLKRMDWLRRFSTQVGLSDHSHVATDGVWASKIALASGADWIERHFTVLDPGNTKDGPVSITPELLKELREFAELPRTERMAKIKSEYPDWMIALGKSQRSLSHTEVLNRDYYRGRFASKIGDQTVYNWEDVSLHAE